MDYGKEATSVTGKVAKPKAKAKAKAKAKPMTAAQIKRLAEHKKHHTAGHMKIMMREMKSGKTFTQAHAIAKKSDK